MTRISVWLCRCGMMVLITLQSMAIAQPLSLSQLRDQVLLHGSSSGWFVQCTIHGSARIAGSGRFIFEPGKRIELNYNQPNRYSLVFFRDGTQTKTVNGIEQKAHRHSPLGSLIFSLMSFQKSLLENHFETTVSGTIDRFSIAFVPKKRMLKILQSVEIMGTNGLVDTVRMLTRDNRIISIHLFPTEQSNEKICE